MTSVSSPSPRMTLLQAAPVHLVGLAAALVASLLTDAQLAAPLAQAAVAGIVLALIDARTSRIPQAIVWPTSIIIMTMLLGISIANSDWQIVIRGALAATAMASAYLIDLLIRPGRAPGLGDVQLAFMLGAITGAVSWPCAVYAWILAVVIKAIPLTVLYLRARHRKRPPSAHPVGPYMILGAALAVVVALIS